MRSILLTMLILAAMRFDAACQTVYQEVDCATMLTNAENEFTAGRFFGIPGMLKECIDGDQYSNEEKRRVYMLLTQVYLLTDDPVTAEDSYLRLLAADPEYVATAESDPIDVVYLSKKFTTTPIFTPHFKVGANMTTPSIIYELGTESTPVTRNYTPNTGFTFGAGIEWNIDDNIGVGGELLLSYKTFDKTINGINGADFLTVTERQYWSDVPIYVRYGYNVGKIRPYAYAGGAFHFLIADRLHLEYTDIEPSFEGIGGDQSLVEGPNLRIEYKRQRINASLVFGGGVKYKWGKNFLLADLRYVAGLKNVTNKKTNYYSNDDEFFISPEVSNYANVSDFFRINNYSISFGFVRPLYDPRKLTKARTKGVSRKLSKQKE